MADRVGDRSGDDRQSEGRDPGAHGRSTHGGIGNAAGGHVFTNFGQLALNSGVIIFQSRDAPQDFREVDGFGRDPGSFQQFLAVAHCIESGGTRSDTAHAQVTHTIGHAAHGSEPGQVLLEFGGIEGNRVQPGQRIRNAILAEIIAGRHLAAEAVAAVQDGHLGGIVGSSLHEHRDIEPGQTHCVGDGALVTEVR